MVVGFGFGFARDWIGCRVYFLNLGRTGWYVLTEKNNESRNNNNNNRFKAKNNNNNNMKVKI